MEEKTLVKGKMSKLNSLSAFFFILCAVFIFGIISISSSGMGTNEQDDLTSMFACGTIISSFLALYFLLRFSGCEITVTDKRVYGKVAFGKRVDLPLDMVSAVGISAFNGVHVATSSGRLTFYLCQNRDEVFNAISVLLMERQSKAASIPSAVIHQETPLSGADEIKKYKELLDSGIITQEEFDAKKKQLLGL